MKGKITDLANKNGEIIVLRVYHPFSEIFEPCQKDDKGAFEYDVEEGHYFPQKEPEDKYFRKVEMTADQYEFLYTLDELIEELEEYGVDTQEDIIREFAYEPTLKGFLEYKLNADHYNLEEYFNVEYDDHFDYDFGNRFGE